MEPTSLFSKEQFEYQQTEYNYPIYRRIRIEREATENFASTQKYFSKYCSGLDCKMTKQIARLERAEKAANDLAIKSRLSIKMQMSMVDNRSNDKN